MAKLKLDSAPPPVLLEGDKRVQALQIARAEPRTPSDYVDAIGLLWTRAHAAFIDIGRLLIKAKETLPHGEYTAAVEAQLPFSSRTAYQLREATRWAMEMEHRKRIAIESLPGSYSTIYLLSTFDPPTLQAAEAEGLLKPELRRAELIAWRKGRGQHVDRRAALEARRAKLRREKERLEEELTRIEEALAAAS